MAVNERHGSGLGQYLDMTLHDCGMALLHPHAANHLLNGKRPVATGNPHPNLAPYATFKTKTCDIFMGVGNDSAFRKLCEFLGMPEVAKDPLFATNGARVTNREALTKLLDDRFATEDGFELCPRMLAAGLPAGPVTHVDQALAAEHTAHREMVTELGDFRALGTPIKMSRTPGGTRSAPPKFGQNTASVLAANGFSAEEIAQLQTDGIVMDKRRG